MTMTIQDASTGARGTAKGTNGALNVVAQGTSQVAGTVAKSQSDGNAQTTSLGAVAAGADAFTAALNVGQGAVLNAMKYGPALGGTGDVLEIQVAAAAAGPWFVAGNGHTDGLLARRIQADGMEYTQVTKGFAGLPWARVRFRPVAALATGASVTLTYEKSSR